RQQGCRSVPQVMKAMAFDARSLEEVLKAMRNSRGIKRIPETGNENEVISLSLLALTYQSRNAPRATRKHALLVLPTFVFSQGAESQLWNRNGPAALFRLRLDKVKSGHVASAAAAIIATSETLQCVSDTQRTGLEVNISPAQPKGFALA